MSERPDDVDPLPDEGELPDSQFPDEDDDDPDTEFPNDEPHKR
ncbi:MAG: hypothetical protein PW844_07010 [Pantoea sp.]|nr:hypothetical protein [Pantoea sp.]MDE1186214.1 hypothetical protein [Pantoea sp.]